MTAEAIGLINVSSIVSAEEIFQKLNEINVANWLCQPGYLNQLS